MVQSGGRRVSCGNDAADLSATIFLALNEQHLIVRKTCGLRKPNKMQAFLCKAKGVFRQPPIIVQQSHTRFFIPFHLSLPQKSHGCTGEAKWEFVQAAISGAGKKIFSPSIQIAFAECLLF